MITSKQHNEFEIINRIRKGDINSYQILVSNYKDISFSLAVSILKNEHLAEDALQEAFIKAYQSLKHFKFNAAFSTWLYRIVVNTCLNHLKSKKLHNSSNEEKILNINSEINTGFDNLIKNDRKKMIQNILKQLKPDEALLLNLFYLSELSIEEIKEVTNFKESKIKVTLHRARKRFKQLVETNLEAKQLIF